MMKFTTVAIAALLALGPLAQQAPAQPTAGHCPPGLAKKDPPCIPPGQVGKAYGVGDRYDGGEGWMRDDRGQYTLPSLPRGESYYRLGETVLRVDDDTRLVLELIDVLTTPSN